VVNLVGISYFACLDEIEIEGWPTPEGQMVSNGARPSREKRHLNTNKWPYWGSQELALKACSQMVFLLDQKIDVRTARTPSVSADIFWGRLSTHSHVNNNKNQDTTTVIN
jgi:hypothetical protein